VKVLKKGNLVRIRKWSIKLELTSLSKPPARTVTSRYLERKTRVKKSLLGSLNCERTLNRIVFYTDSLMLDRNVLKYW